MFTLLRPFLSLQLVIVPARKCQGVSGTCAVDLLQMKSQRQRVVEEPDEARRVLCDIAFANKGPIVWNSYGLPAPASEHYSELLCTRSRFSKNESVLSSSSNTIVAFKTARTGSTWLASLLEAAGASIFFEPFSRKNCYHKSDRNYEETAMRTLLTRSCIVSTEVRTAIKKKPELLCRPDDYCTNASFDGSSKGVALNPRFIDRLDWSNVLKDLNVRFVNLRRTNLVALAYSKFHHGGCEPHESTDFSFDALLACVKHYAIGDQEFASYAAIVASGYVSYHSSPLLILYEDVVQDPDGLEKRIFGGAISSTDPALSILSLRAIIEQRRNTLDPMDDPKDEGIEGITVKLHSSDICTYDDVNCTELESNMQRMDYPCLLKQLTINSSSVAWTLPMLRNGQVSVHGDCQILVPLNGGDRKYADLLTPVSW